MPSTPNLALFIPLVVFALTFAFALMAGELYFGSGKRRPRRRSGNWQNRPPSRPDLKLVAPTTRSIDPAAQLRAVMGAEFRSKKVISHTEAKVMAAAEAAIEEAGLRWRVMAQVSLGEVLASEDEAAFYAINAKRVDLLIMSEKRDALAAIEYQGEGHYQGTAPARDAIKKEALRKAGVRYIEITHDHGPEDVRREISRLVWLHSNDPKETTRKITGA